MSLRELDILLIDDDEDDCVFAGDILAEIPAPRHRLDWKATCDEALEFARTRSYNTFLLGGPRKNSEVARRKRYRRILETALEGAWIHDENRKTCTPTDMLGHGIQEIYEGSPFLFRDDTACPYAPHE
ncbi:MAG: hypothetical protein ABFD98_17305 [Syntrophobacteraceae bacterium]|nr:hypothetical protein [Desulfobacteraceae bacterium]